MAAHTIAYDVHISLIATCISHVSLLQASNLLWNEGYCNRWQE